MVSRWVAILVGSAVPVCAGAFASACIPDPRGDFENYTERTGQFRTVADASSDSVAPEGTVEGLYFTACLSKLAAGRVDRVLRFYTQLKFTPTPGGPNAGKISLELTALKLGPLDANGNPGPPPTVSADQKVGETYKIVDAPTNALGVYQGAIGVLNPGKGKTEVKVPGDANPISGRAITIETAAVNGRFAAGTFCSQLSGEVVDPTIITLEGDANTCLYFPVKEGDKPPELKKDTSDFKSGCPLQ